MTTWHELHTGVVHPWLCDQFEHLNVRNYSNLFNEAQFFAYARAGFPQSVALKHGGHGVAAICRTNFLKELPMGSLIHIDGGMVAASNKTFTFFAVCTMQRLTNYTRLQSHWKCFLTQLVENQLLFRMFSARSYKIR